MQRRTDTHLDFLDCLRGVAILAVFLFHCHGAVYGWNVDFSHATPDYILLSPLFIGGAGVSMFFAISGFCIHLSHQRSARKDFTTFFTRRFFRIYPPYLVALLIFSFLPPWGSGNFHLFFLRTQFFSHLFLVHNFSDQTFFGINGAFWSIAIEVQLYLLYPVLLALVRGLTWNRMLGITFALEAAIRAYAGICAIEHVQPLGLIMGLPFGYWFSWSSGAAAADAFLNGKKLPFSSFPIWLLAALAVGLGSFPLMAPFFFVFAALCTVRVIALFLSTSRPEQPTRFSWASGHLRFAGLVSYSAYLLHLPLVIVVEEKLSASHFHLAPLAVFLITSATWIPLLFLSWCFYRLLELPSIALGKKFSR